MYAAFQNLIQSFLERPLAAAFGIFGFLCLLIWPLFRARRAMLTAQFGIGIGYCLHYLLIGAWTGAGITALGASQTAFSIWVAGHPRLRVALLGFLPLVAGVTWATWGACPRSSPAPRLRSSCSGGCSAMKSVCASSCSRRRRSG